MHAADQLCHWLQRLQTLWSGGGGLGLDEEVGVFGQDSLRISTFQIIKWFRKFTKLFFPMSPFFNNKCPLGCSKKYFFWIWIMALSILPCMGLMKAGEKKLGFLMHFLLSAAHFSKSPNIQRKLAQIDKIFCFDHYVLHKVLFYIPFSLLICIFPLLLIDSNNNCIQDHI